MPDTTPPTQGTASTSNGTATPSQGDVTPEWAKSLSEGITSLVDHVKGLRAAAETPRPQPQPVVEEEEEEPASTLDDPNLDLQPMSVVARRILSEVEGVVDRALKPVTERESVSLYPYCTAM